MGMGICGEFVNIIRLQVEYQGNGTVLNLFMTGVSCTGGNSYYNKEPSSCKYGLWDDTYIYIYIFTQYIYIYILYTVHMYLRIYIYNELYNHQYGIWPCLEPDSNHRKICINRAGRAPRVAASHISP